MSRRHSKNGLTVRGLIESSPLTSSTSSDELIDFRVHRGPCGAAAASSPSAVELRSRRTVHEPKPHGQDSLLRARGAHPGHLRQLVDRKPPRPRVGMWQRASVQRTERATGDGASSCGGLGQPPGCTSATLFGFDSEDDSSAESSDVENATESPSTMRRRKSGLLTSLILCSILNSGLGRDAKCRRTRREWDGYLRGEPRSHFSRMFRMDHDTFMHILHTVGPHLSRNFHQSERSGGFVSPSLQLGMTIRWLAGICFPRGTECHSFAEGRGGWAGLRAGESVCVFYSGRLLILTIEAG